MDLIIKINLDNAAYATDTAQALTAPGGDGRAIEIARNLSDVSEWIMQGYISHSIYDSNGNKSGLFEINYTASDLEKPQAVGMVYFSYIDKALNCLREANEPFLANESPEAAARRYLGRNSHLYAAQVEFLKIDFIEKA